MPASDVYQFVVGADRLGAPAPHGFTINPSDTDDLPFVTRAIRVGITGDVTVTMLGGETLPIPAMQAGETLSIRVTRVLATGTTAGGITGLY